MIRSNLIRIAAVLVAVVPLSCLAGTVKDLGTVGTVYEITEPNFLTELRAGAPHIDMEKQRRESAHYQPKDLRKLPRVTENRVFDVDMTSILTHDIRDASGRVLYPAGFKYNPLRYAGFVPGIVVIDGSDPEQVEWFEKSPYYPNKMVMLLISDGYAFELAGKLKRPVYYLTEIIAERFRLTAAPTIIVRDGDAVSVKEVKIGK